MKTRGRRAGSRHRRRTNALLATSKKVLETKKNGSATALPTTTMVEDKRVNKHNPSPFSLKVLSSSQQLGRVKATPIIAGPPPLPPPLAPPSSSNVETQLIKLSSSWQSCPLSSTQLTEQPSSFHLLHNLNDGGDSNVQQRSILVKGLSKTQFPSPKKVKEYFSIFGKISKCIIDPPKAPSYSTNHPEKGLLGKMNVYITYLTERSAIDAVKATNGKYVEGKYVRQLDFRSILPFHKYC